MVNKEILHTLYQQKLSWEHAYTFNNKKTRQQRSATYMQKQAKCMQNCAIAQHSPSHTFPSSISYDTRSKSKQSLKAKEKEQKEGSSRRVR